MKAISPTNITENYILDFILFLYATITREVFTITTHNFNRARNPPKRGSNIVEAISIVNHKSGFNF